MSNVTLMGPQSLDGLTTLKHVCEEAENGQTEAVIIIRLMKDGSQKIDTSFMNHYEKCFLKAFFDAWIFRWFDEMQPAPSEKV